MKVILIPIAILTSCAAASADSLHSKIQSLDGTVCMALLSNNIGAFDAAMKPNVTSDFKYFDKVGSKPMTYQKMLATMKMGMGMMSKMTAARAKPLNVKESGSTATVTTTHQMAGIMKGPDKKSHTMEFGGVSIDVYRKVGGTWKMASMTWKSSTQKMDGQAMRASAAE